ncbi:hypothetical protein D5086_006378 [Populus alba]|uniref:Uncharacterized protein n=1 Tax=Populus alba TaxID=43335 RepID=A0ACC4CKH5_POPAL
MTIGMPLCQDSQIHGVVYWQPPRKALNKVKELVWEPSISRHGADEGIPELKEGLMQKECDSEHSACFQLDDLCYGSGEDHVKNRDIILEALSTLREGAVKGGEGAIYLWAKLPEQYVDDDKVVRWLATRHGVVVIPGGACGCPGHPRLSLFGRPDRE